ncbi:recombination directionality factor [Nocardioides sp. AX2bis]|uniref:recombination directionality factor n=1 Tax=Nocardioides sp. AX2bis TaxID=2653157 RepID=UPI0012EFC14D|nr:hypothetical protein [Nocardioides sp. AX2bis]VXB33871.1 conserved hypothetical protein [Nocardioides sp. AX2bis]
MPISPATLQRRFAELGRIRLGAKEGGKGRPMKLAAFRFTSPNPRYIADLATLYGGEARPWDNNGKPEHEVFTDSTSIPVIAMKGGLSQWMETWSGGGCVHRCDGETNVLTGERCNPDDRAHVDAKPTTRLSLMLPELEAIGAWRMESHGWNAAAEIPAVAELAQFVGDLVPAHLNMVERRSVRDGKTSRFVVPVLDLQIGAARLREVVAAKSGAAELAGPVPAEHAALPAGAPAEPNVDPYAGPTADLTGIDTHDGLVQAWDSMKSDELIGQAARGNPAASPEGAQRYVEAWKARAHQIQDAKEAAPAPDADGAVDADIVEDQAPATQPAAAPAEAAPVSEDALWQQILAASGQQGMQLPDVEDDFARRMGGVTSSTASAAELQHYLGLLTAGEQVPA